MLNVLKILTDERYFMIINFSIVIWLYINGYIDFNNILVDIFIVAFLSYGLTLLTTSIVLISIYVILKNRLNSGLIHKYTFFQQLEAISTILEFYIDDMNDIKEFDLYFERVLFKEIKY